MIFHTLKEQTPRGLKTYAVQIIIFLLPANAFAAGESISINDYLPIMPTVVSLLAIGAAIAAIVGFHLSKIQEGKRHAGLYRFIPAIFVALDRDGNILGHEAGDRAEDFPSSWKKISDIPNLNHATFLNTAREVIDTGKPALVHYEFQNEQRCASFSRLPENMYGKPAAIWVSQSVEDLISAHQDTELVKRKFLQTLHAMREAVIITDAAGKVQTINPAAAILTGWSEKEASGRVLEEVFRIKDAEELSGKVPVHEMLRLRHKIGQVKELTLIDRAGKEHSVEDSSLPVTNDRGTLEGMVLVFRDTTEENRHREQLKDAVENLETAASLARLFAFECDENGALYGVNTTPGQFWSINGEGKPVPFGTWIYPDDLEEFLRQWNDLLHGTTAKMKCSYRSKYYGSMRYYNCTVTRKILPDRTIHYSGVIQDMTSFNESKRQYDDLNSLMDMLTHHLPCVFFAKNADDNYRYVLCSEEFCKFVNQAEESVKGKTDYDLFLCREDADGFRANDENTMQARTLQTYLESSIRHDGVRRTIRVQKASLTLSDGKRLLVGMGFDISEYMLLKQQGREFEELFRSLIENLTDSVAVFNPEKNDELIYCNQNFANLMHAANPDSLYKAGSRFPVTHESLEMFREHNRQTLNSGVPSVQNETFRLNTDTAQRYCRVMRLPVKVAGGRTLMLIDIHDLPPDMRPGRKEHSYSSRIRDLMECERAIATLRKNVRTNPDKKMAAVREFLGDLATRLHQAPIFLGLFKDDGRSFHILFEENPQPETLKQALCELYPHLYGKFKGQDVVNLPDIANSEYASFFMDTRMKAMMAVPLHYGGKLRGALGIAGNLHDNCFSQVDKVILRASAAVIERMLDDTRREEIKRFSEQEKHLLLDSIKIPIWIYSRTGKPLFTNATVCAAAHMSQENILEHKCSDLFCKDGNEANCPVLKTIHSGKGATRTAVIAGRLYLVCAEPVYRDGKLDCVIKYGIDITDMKDDEGSAKKV